MKRFEVLKNISTVLLLLEIFLKPPSPLVQQPSPELLINKFSIQQAFYEHLLRYWNHEMNSEPTLK